MQRNYNALDVGELNFLLSLVREEHTKVSMKLTKDNLSRIDEHEILMNIGRIERTMNRLDGIRIGIIYPLSREQHYESVAMITDG